MDNAWARGQGCRASEPSLGTPPAPHVRPPRNSPNPVLLGSFLFLGKLHYIGTIE